MSETLGMSILRKVAEHYETRPGSWCQGVGDLHRVAQEDPATISASLQEAGRQGCMYTMICCYAGMQYRGRVRNAARADAVRIVCERFGRAVSPGSIMSLNDMSGATQKIAAAMIRRALSSEPAAVRA